METIQPTLKPNAMQKRALPIWFLLVIWFVLPSFSQHYKNFKVAVYCCAYEIQKMIDTTGYLMLIWNEMTRQLKVGKVCIETHRDLIIVDQKILDI